MKRIDEINVNVEVLEKELTVPKYLTFIDNKEEDFAALIQAWPKIRDGVVEVLNKEGNPTAGHVTVVTLFRLGFNKPWPGSDPNPRTVYIGLACPGNPMTAKMCFVNDQLQACVGKLGSGFRLEILMEHNVVSHLAAGFAGPDIPPSLSPAYQFPSGYGRRVKAGADFGPEEGGYAGRNSGFGTLGCWVQIKLKGREEWMTMGLTCYHAARSFIPGYKAPTVTTQADGAPGIPLYPELSSEMPCWHADRRYSFPATILQERWAAVEHPSRMRHQFNINDLGFAITQTRNRGLDTTDRDQELAKAKAFFAQKTQIFGDFYLASGFTQRSAPKGRLDWALIKPRTAERVGGNPLPSFQEWTAQGYSRAEMPLIGGPSTTMQPRGDESMHNYVQDGAIIRDPAEKLYVFKKGAASKCTAGELSYIKAAVALGPVNCVFYPKSEERLSSEFVVGPIESSQRTKFGFPGDSGSVVFDRVGRVLGLLFSGEVKPYQCDRGLSFVTPIEDIFKDIVDRSDGNIEGVRLLGEGEDDVVMGSN